MAFAAAASAAVASKSVFDYNRESFMEDREQRMKKEFAERRFRVVQANLWREDVRSFVELTEKKMSIYLLVNVLMLGFTLNLWCEGRVPEDTTPNWLMMGNQLAIVGAFCFLLLTVWLAMHASVAAQSYQTRVLTQLVRLPIPSWDELEACRTYGSEFERLEPRQMFRVPFLTGTQEEVLRSTVGAGAGSEGEPGSASGRATSSGPPSSAGGGLAASGAGSSVGAGLSLATDPWGLEKRGDDTYELGCHIGSDVAKLRHIKLMRQAAVYWQTYDAFARVSMSIGVNQLMLAMSYYILAYALSQVQAPIPAFCGVIVLICTAEVVAQIDLTLPAFQQRIIQFLLVLGPGISCVAGWHWSHRHDLAARIAECLAPIAFFSHGAVIALLTMVLRVREQENGAMLPLAFQGVLYLDVFGWVWHKHATPIASGSSDVGRSRRQLLASRLSMLPAARDTWMPSRRLSSLASSRALGTVEEEPGDMGYYAMDYLEEAPEGGKRRAPQSEDEPDVESGTGKDMPAVACVLYDADGRPVPTRPEEMSKQGSVHDLRLVPGAPRMQDEVNALEPPAKEFWNPVTFMPPESRRRHKMDEFLAEHPDNSGGASGKANDSAAEGMGTFGDYSEDTPIKTGHDNEMPGVLPWQVFKLAAIISSMAWILGGVYFTLHVNHIWTMELPWWWEIEAQTATGQEGAKSPKILRMMMSGLQTGQRVVPEPGVLGLWAAGLSGSSVGPALERVEVAWPYPSVAPRGLSCDPNGTQLIVTDGLSAFAAKLSAMPAPRQAALAPPSAVGASSTRVRAHFRQLPRCPAVMGKSVEDVALICSHGNSTGGASPCEALLLHGRGRRLASCPLTSKQATSREGQATRVDSIASGWLHSGERVEEATSLLVDPVCVATEVGPSRNCASVGTTHGRVAQLQGRADGRPELVPSNIFKAQGKSVNGKVDSSASGGVRAFNERYVGVLQTHRRSIRVLDSANDGAEVGTLLLPTDEPIGAFCAGGGQLYVLGRGPSPGLWRFALPEGGLRPAAPAAARA